MDVLLAVPHALGDRLTRRIVQDFPGAHITAATPEHLADLLDSRTWDLVVVRDEALKMLDDGIRASLGVESVVAVPDTVSQDPGWVGDEIAARLRQAAAARQAGPDAPRGATASLQQFVETHGDSPAVMYEILRLYAAEAPQRLASIDAALPGSRRADCDYAAVAKAAHSLANTCGTLQCTAAVEEARALESAAKGECSARCLVHAGRLDSIVTALVEAVKAHLARLS